MKVFLKNVIFLANFFLIAILVMNSLYKKIGFGYFKKVISKPGITFFTRDNKIKYSDNNSYKIESKDYNNATFYKNIKVEKNTAYRITCMIKTEDVEILDKSYENSGAKISLLNCAEQSKGVIGTSDWQLVSLLFNSGENSDLNVGFMLGGDCEFGNVKGKAWFSDFKIENGQLDEYNNWKFVCFVFKNIDVTLNGINYKYSMTDNDVYQIKNCIKGFESTCSYFSNNQMNASCKIIEIDTPIKTLSYDKEKGYYLDPKDVSENIDKYLNLDYYDHIFVCTRLSDDKSSIPFNNWIGLGCMEYKNMGFSDIRMPTSSKSCQYIYDENLNMFPEEVFIHEFLHTLEKNSRKYGYDVPSLHDYEKFGYETDNIYGLYYWYKDYMTKNIDGKLGLDKEIYKFKPIDDENFVDCQILNEFEDVKNIFERLNLVIKTINDNI